MDNVAIPFMTATLSRTDIEALEAYVSDNAATYGHVSVILSRFGF
jgi:hypothetical protein